ncbi:MAG: endonuclease MutS2 [Desulfuromonadaceae bacterium]|nr:endonuclease MutS2 [Desulfuromonadaceae bacterium]MDD2853965.1 endonuclease MutS2 [Desulfuromonadaceae bacterium]
MIKTETVNSLEFNKILTEIATHAHSAATVEKITAIKPENSIAKIEQISGRVSEICKLKESGITLALENFEDIRQSFEVLKPNGAILPTVELLKFIPVLRSCGSLSRQLNYRHDLPLLKSIEPMLRSFPEILEPLENSIDIDGSIKDTASELLKETRCAKRTLAARIRKKIDEIIRNSDIEKFLQENFITQRSGRWVIPVRMDSKGMVKGVVHDVSSSGETAFMEPLEIIPFTNELENLNAEEKAEEIRILRQLSSWVREDLEILTGCFDTLLEIDRLNSISMFSADYNLNKPKINENGEFRLVNARHPILIQMHKQNLLEKIEPLEIRLGGEAEESVMIITGPNAGGKTIAIKTAGILMLMALSGIPVPADSESQFPIIDSLLVDIGDEQSIEQKHSTFSAHIARITSIIQQSSMRSMILLDELGAGTDPLQGAAIACGVLRELQLRGSLVIATTHLSDIISFVHKTTGMINAGMAFDDNSFTPLYRLVIGVPGESHALEVARRFGLPEKIISFARQMIGTDGSEISEMLKDLRQKRTEFENLLSDLEEQKRIVDLRNIELNIRVDEIEQIRKETAEKGYSEAKMLISTTRRRMNIILEELKRDNRSEIINKIREAEKDLLTQIKQEANINENKGITSVKAGDSVFVDSIGCIGQVLSSENRNGKVRIRAGRMELEVRLSDLSRSEKSESIKLMKAASIVWKSDIDENASNEVKLIGLRVDDALSELDTFINRMFSAGIKDIRIIHGLGSGRLRDAVREELKRHTLVECFRSGEAHEGRDGATFATLKV